MTSVSTVNGSYAYINDLMQLGTSGHGSSVDPMIMGISTPLKLDTWKTKLHRHPDLDFTDYILRGIEHGSGSRASSTHVWVCPRLVQRHTSQPQPMQRGAAQVPEASPVGG